MFDGFIIGIFIATIFIQYYTGSMSRTLDKILEELQGHNDDEELIR